VAERTVALTGIKPTGRPHIGNWLGMIRPAIALADEPGVEALYFIADYHGLTTVRDRATLRALTLDCAATWLAFGLDPEKTVLYRQSDVPEVFELAWILACHTPKGFMNKSHAYKAARDANEAGGEDPDAGISMGLFSYPVLMAADILAVDADVVPVGKDQVQHVEIARDIAERVNHTWGEGTLRLPAVRVKSESAVVPGVDGRKMSKSYDNALPCFGSPAELRKAVMRIATDSTPPDAPKDPDSSLVFRIHRALLDEAVGASLAARYRAGISWGAAKKLLADDLETQLEGARARYASWIARPEAIDLLLAEGARRARRIAGPVLGRVRAALGVSSSA
jgi:tryptophanyl-tRNA synthetase